MDLRFPLGEALSWAHPSHQAHGPCPPWTGRAVGAAGAPGPTPCTTSAPSHLPQSGLIPRRRLTLFWPSLGAQYVAEAEEKLQRARLLVESVRKEKVDLSNQLEEERRYALPLPCSWEDIFLSLLKRDKEEHGLGTSRPRPNLVSTTYRRCHMD